MPLTIAEVTQRPVMFTEPVELTAARLDRGRLSCRPLLKVASIHPGTALTCQQTGPGRIRLTANADADVSLDRPHVTADTRLLLPVAARSLLGVEPDGLVIAYTVSEGVIDVAPAAASPSRC